MKDKIFKAKSTLSLYCHASSTDSASLSPSLVNFSIYSILTLTHLWFLQVWQGTARCMFSTVSKQHYLLSKASTGFLTQQIPLSVGHVSRHICLLHLDVQQPAIKRPRAKLQLTALDVEGKPPHIHATGADKYSFKKKKAVGAGKMASSDM